MTSARYVHGHHESVLRSHEWRTAENSAGFLLPHLRPGLRLLDVGCGPGTITADLAALLAPGEVIGVDRSAEVIDRAAERFGNVDNLSFRVDDVMALDLPDDAVDVVYAHQVLQHVADPVGAAREMRRVCRPGGIIAVRDADYAAFAWSPGDPLLDAWLGLYRQAARDDRGEPDAGRHLLAWLHDAGCTRVTAGASVWCFADEATRSWWGGLWSERIVDSDLATQLLDSGAATQDELLEIAAAFRRWAADVNGWWIVPHGEVIAAP